STKGAGELTAHHGPRPPRTETPTMTSPAGGTVSGTGPSPVNDPAPLPHGRISREELLSTLGPDNRVARFGPRSVRKPLSRPERDDGGTSQTSIRRHPP